MESHSLSLLFFRINTRYTHIKKITTDNKTIAERKTDFLCLFYENLIFKISEECYIETRYKNSVFYLLTVLFYV